MGRLLRIAATAAAAVLIDPSAASATGDGDYTTETFGGVLTDRPAARAVHLAAGDALAVRVRPTDERPSELGIGVAMPLEQLPFDFDDADFYADLYSDELFENFYSADLFSDYFFSDSESPGWSPSDFGVVVTSNDYEDPLGMAEEACDEQRLFFEVAGRGWGSGRFSGSWLMFVAPVEADFNVVLTGGGGFEVTLSVHRLPPLPQATTPPAESLPPFDPDAVAPALLVPYTGDAWRRIVTSHLDFFFDPEVVGDSDDFYSDYFSDDGIFTAGQDESFGPSPELRSAIEASCGQ